MKKREDPLLKQPSGHVDYKERKGEEKKNTAAKKRKYGGGRNCGSEPAKFSI